MRNTYRTVASNAQLKELILWAQDVVRLRQVEDLPDYTNQNNIYVSGRSSARIPSSSADVLAEDVLGDTVTAVDGSYQYTLVSVSGTLTWARVALDTAW